MLSRYGVFAAFGACLALAAPAHALNVTFAGQVGSSAPLTVGSGPSAVTFTSTAPTGTFTVASTAGLFTGFATGLGDFGSFSGDPLTISFATPVVAPLAITFGIEDAFGLSGGDTLNVTTNLGFSGVASSALDNLPLAEPEGTFTISNPGFTSLTITSANPFAIGSLTSVPEPFTLSLLGVSLAGMAAIRRRRL